MGEKKLIESVAILVREEEEERTKIHSKRRVRAFGKRRDKIRKADAAMISDNIYVMTVCRHTTG